MLNIVGATMLNIKSAKFTVYYSDANRICYGIQ